MSDEKTCRATSPEASPDALLRAILKRALIMHRDSRDTVAEELSKRLHRNISVATLDKWVASNQVAWHLPADAIPVLCEILQDDGLQRHLLSPKMRERLELGEFISASEALLENALNQLREVKRAKQVRR